MNAMAFIWFFRWLGTFYVVCAAEAGLFWLGSRDEEWTLRLAAAEKMILTGANVLCTCCILFLRNNYFWTDVLLGCFAAGLMAAAVMDLWEQLVYRYVWWAAGAAALGILFVRICEGEAEGTVGPLILYLILQQTVFARFYGRADCHAFSVCAVGMTALGMRISDYLVHMALTFGALAAVQWLLGNVAGSGRLKRPVPLIPYIVTAFWLWVDFTVGKWYI